ncbi:MAG: autotransporter domain-containing protein [Pseudomonadota bacterium]
MTMNVSINPVSGYASARAKYLFGCAAVALSAAAMAAPAYAADECGPVVAGIATCVAAGNPYPAGITYVAAAPVTLVAPDGIVVTTAAAATNGITISGTNAITLGGAATVSVTGAGSNGVRLTSTGGPVIASLGSVSAALGDGVILSGTTASLTTASGSMLFGGNRGAVLTSASGSSLNNAGTISGGSYAVQTSGGPATITNTGTITGAVALAGGGSLLTNAGTFNAAGTSSFGAGDRFANTGLVTVGATSLTPTAATFAGLATFDNSGTISLQNGHAGDTLTLGGNYIGSGNARLALDAAPGALLNADRLIVAGSATGFTAVDLALPAGSQPLFNTGSVLVQTGAGSSANAFGVTAATATAGLVRYDIAYNPVAATYSLVAGPSDAAYNMLSFGTAQRSLWNKSADAVTAQLQSRRDALWSLGDGAPAGKLWLTMGGSVDKVEGTRDFGLAGQPHLTNTGYQQDYFGGQVGLGLSGGVSTRGGFAVGLTGGYINSRAKFGGTAERINFDAINGGVYASFTSGNLFINALGKYDYYWARATSLAGGYEVKTKGSAYGARGEIGLRFGSDSFFMEPLAQLSYVHTSLDPFGVQGTSVNFDGRSGLRGKAGARFGGVTSIGSDAKLSFYAGASYVHGFKDEGQVTFANGGGTFTAMRGRMPDYGEAVAGFTIAQNQSVSGFMEANYTRTFKTGTGDSAKLQGAGGRVGINFKF